MSILRKSIDAINNSFSDRTVINALTALAVPAAWGEIYIDEDNTAATDITGTTDADYEPVAGTWILSGEAVNIEMPTNGQLTYVGDGRIHVLVIATVSLTSAGNNDVVHVDLAKNGVRIANSDATQKLATGADVANITSVAMFGMVNGDYVTITVRNETAPNDLTAVHGNIALQGARA